jgi:nucleotide-binding universal stress UspA family protein
MSNTIIVGVDFSPECEVAVEDAMGLARHLGTSVTLALSTFIPDHPEGLPPALVASYVKYAADFKARLAAERDKLASLRQRFEGQGVELSLALLDGRPEVMIPQLSKEVNAALVAVGTHGRTGFRRVSMGSIAEKIVRYEERPVLVARGPASAGGYHHIVVGLDFSEPARKALQAARSYLAPGGKLEMVHCWQLPMWSFASGAPMLGDNVAQFQAELLGSIRETGEKWLAELGPLNGDASFHSLERTPSAGLDAWAIEHRADLIVVGSHGYQGLRRWLIGSVAETTVRHAACSVIVVH